MKILRLIAAVLIFTCLAVSLPISAADSEKLSLGLHSSLPTDGMISLGQTFTVSVDIGEMNSGFSAGTVLFYVSDNLTPISATLLGGDIEIREIISGEHEGAYGIAILVEDDINEINKELCTATFRVDKLGDFSVKLDTYQLIDSGLSDINVTVTPSEIKGKTKTPNKPIILTETLPRGFMGKPYSAVIEADSAEYISFEMTDGELPSGLLLKDNGAVEGIPTEYGEFSFSVTATLAETVSSEPRIYKLTVLEKPEKLELSSESKYSIDDKGYIRNIVAKTTVTAFLDNFKDKANVKVVNAKGVEISNDSYVGTGSKIFLMDGEAVLHELTAVIKGDVSGDGMIGTLDYQRVRAHYLKNYTLTDANCEAAIAVIGNGTIGTLTYQRVRAHYNGNYNLYK